MLPVASARVPAASSIVAAVSPLSPARACVSCAVVAPTCNTSAGRLRKAIPSPIASRIGKRKVQKIASGSRKNSRKRIEVS
jgi:hypothetical protein